MCRDNRIVGYGIMELWLWGGLLLVAFGAAYARNHRHDLRKPIIDSINKVASRLERHSVGIIIGCAIIWTTFVVVSGTGFELTNTHWDFTNTGALGDSFGVLSSGMAGIAAYFAFRTYKAASDEARLATKRAAEPSYLNLLERRFDMMEHITRVLPTRARSMGPSNAEKGQEALDWAADTLWPRLSSANDKKECVTVYGDFVAEAIKGLTNYHRFVYHILSFAERQFSEIPPDMPMLKTDPSYSYIQLLRAQLSDSEMQLIAFNAAYGAGDPKLKRYIERYALFNNMLDVDIVELGLPLLFEPTAFGLVLEDRPAVVVNWQ